jgi:hypothetical protein
MTDFFFRKKTFDRIYFRQKSHLTEKKCAQGRLTESSFDRKLFLEMILYFHLGHGAPGGDKEIWAIKLYSGRMQIQK